MSNLTHVWIRLRIVQQSNEPAPRTGETVYQMRKDGAPSDLWVLISPDVAKVLDAASWDYVHWVIESNLELAFGPESIDKGWTVGGIVMDGNTTDDHLGWSSGSLPVNVASKGHPNPWETGVHYVMGIEEGGTAPPNTTPPYEYAYTINIEFAGGQYSADPKLSLGSPPM